MPNFNLTGIFISKWSILVEGKIGGGQMFFERKEVKQEKPKTFFWTFLKWYWFIVPSLYYILVVPSLALNEGGSLVTGQDIFTMLFQLSNYILSGLMFVTNPMERSKNGVADKFLKIAVVQQIMLRNILGVILGLLAWYQLPETISRQQLEEVDTESDSEEDRERYFKPKTILIIAVISLVLTIATTIGYLSFIKK